MQNSVLQRQNQILDQADKTRDAMFNLLGVPAGTELPAFDLESEMAIEREFFDLERSLGPGLQPGRVYSEPFADGRACYLITEIEGEAVTLRHVSFGDAWTLTHIENRDLVISRDEARANIDHKDRIDVFFAEHR